MPKSADQIVESCRMFRRLEPDQLKLLCGMAVPKTYRRQHIVFQQMDPCPGLFIVGEGLVRVYNLAASGKEHVLHLVEPGATFAEVAAIGGFPCPANAETVEPTTCVLLPTQLLRHALMTDHALCLGLLGSMAKWVKHLVGLMEDIVLRDAISRVANYLLQATPQPTAEIELPALKKHLASHLNLTSETLSRTFRRLNEADLVEETQARRIRIIDPGKLRDVAEGFFPEI